MNIFLKEDELEEINPLKESQDKGITINPHKSEGRPTKENEIPDSIKEIIAIDAINTSSRDAAALHGIGRNRANDLTNGIGIKDPDIRARVLDVKHGIQDAAITKLMDTLELIDPRELDSVKERVMVLNSLSNLVDKLSGDGGKDVKQVHLHMYAPNMKKEADYDVIEA